MHLTPSNFIHMISCSCSSTTTDVAAMYWVDILCIYVIVDLFCPLFLKSIQDITSLRNYNYEHTQT